MLGAPWGEGENMGNPCMANPALHKKKKKNWFCEQMMAHSELLPVSVAVAPSCSSEPWPNTPSKKIRNCNKLQNSYKACHGRSSSDCKANPSVFFGPSHVSLCFTNLRRSMYVMFIPANVCEKTLQICHRGASLTIPLQVWASGVTVLPPGISWNIWHPKDVTWFEWSLWMVTSYQWQHLRSSHSKTL